MKKTISVHRELMITIILTGDNERDQIALENYDFDGLCSTWVEKRDMTRTPHEPKIFLINEKGIFSHSLTENNVLSIWKETIKLVDCNE